jgi:predicted DNA-binding protein with PD1-like motif
MRSTLLNDADGLRTFAVVMDKGDEAAEELLPFARRRQVTGAGVTAIGARQEASSAYFDPETTQYQDIPVTEQVEVLSLVGDIATKDGEPALHAHAVLRRRDGTLRKRIDEETALALLALDAS